MSRLSRLIPLKFALLLLAPLAQSQELYDRAVLRTIDLQFVPSDWHAQLVVNKASGLEQYLAADLTVDGILYPSVGVRYKGNSSYWIAAAGQKLPLNIDLKAFGVDQKVLGHSKLVLNNQWSDTSLMREVLAYKIMGEFMPAPQANFVKVVINGVNYGIYTSVEHVGGDFCETHFGSADGFRYKAVPPDTWPDTFFTPPPPGDLALQDLNGSLSRAERAYELKNRDGEPNPHMDVLAAIDVLNNTSSDLLVDALNPLMDTDLVIRHLAINNVICSLDAYFESGRNYYLFNDPQHQRLSILPWDYNMAFGSYGNRGNSTMSPTAGKGDTDRPLLANLIKGGVLRQEYLAHMHHMHTHGLNPVDLHAEIDALRALIDAEVQVDTRLAMSYSNWTAGIASLKSFIDSRSSYLSSHSLLDVERPEYLAVGHSPSQPTSADTVLLWAQVENLVDPVKTVLAYYRARGAFIEVELFDDGLNGDGAANDGLYAATLPALPGGSQIEYYFRAKCLNDNGVSFSPDSASFEPHSLFVQPTADDSDVLINEFVASNNNGPVDELGEHEDWIELHNHGANPVDLSGMWLADDINDPLQWQIPAGTILAADETLLIWADGEPLEGPLHTNFRLSLSGEDVCLHSADGFTMLDSISFGLQESDVSTARLMDGNDLWVTLSTPTPAALNQITCGARSYDGMDSARNIASLSLSGAPSPGATVNLHLTNFNANQFMQLSVGIAPVVLDHVGSGLTLLVQSSIFQAPVTTDGNGEAQFDFTIPANSNLIGQSFFLQAGTGGPNAIASHGLEVVVCP
jgi:hypothetical protein